MTDVMLVYAVFADDQTAQSVARIVVEERLAACANIQSPCMSIFRWEGDIARETEIPVLFKTSADQHDSLIERIAMLHSYAIPAIVSWPATGAHPPFAAWIHTETQA